MSTYTDFAEKMIIALYQETERTEQQYYKLGELIDRYGLEAKETWIHRLADEWEYGFASDVSRYLGGSSREWDVRISAEGMRYIEEKYGDKDGVGSLLEPLPPGVRLSSGRVLVSDGPVPTDFQGQEGDLLLEVGQASQIDSSAWTGLPKQGTLTREASGRLATALKIAEQALDESKATNEERAQARSYIVAIQALADAPEPPADLIWQLVQRANSVAGIASFFVALMALFAHG